MKKISVEVIKKILEDFNVNNISLIIDSMVIEEQAITDEIKDKKKKEKEELDSIKEVPFICDKLEDGIDYKEKIEELVDSFDWHDTFYDSDGMDDDGDDGVNYFLIENKLYMVELHCEAEWIGDWSVRKNLPGRVSVTEITEIPSFEIIEDYGDDGAIVKILN